MPIKHNTNQRRGHETKKKTKRDHKQTERKKKTTKNQSNKHPISKKTGQGNFLAWYCNIPDESEEEEAADQLQPEEKPEHPDKDRPMEEEEEKRGPAGALRIEAGGGEPQHQAHQGDDGDEGKKVTHRNNSPNQAQMGHKQDHHEMEAERQLASRTTKTGKTTKETYGKLQNKRLHQTQKSARQEQDTNQQTEEENRKNKPTMNQTP